MKQFFKEMRLMFFLCAMILIISSFKPFGTQANEIYMNQVGANVTVTIIQDGQNNSIGTSSTPTSLDGNNIDVTINQETNGGSIGLSVNGNDNEMIIKQKCHNGSSCNADTMNINVTGTSNSMQLGQGYKITTNDWQYDGTEHGGHDMELSVSGNDNAIKLSQRSQNNTSDHNMDIDITGNDNNVHVMQEANQDKTLDLTINNNDNNVFIHQKKSYGHTANVTLDGSYGTSLNLYQGTSSSTSARSYTLNQNCVTVGGCSLSVTQQ